MAAAHETVLGRDLYLTDDFRLASAGGLLTVAGVESLRCALERRLITSPGEVYHRPLYGAGLKRYLNKPISERTAKEIRQRVLEQIGQEQRISRVADVSITLGADQILYVSVACEQGGTPMPPFTIEVRP